MRPSEKQESPDFSRGELQGLNEVRTHQARTSILNGGGPFPWGRHQLLIGSVVQARQHAVKIFMFPLLTIFLTFLEED